MAIAPFFFCVFDVLFVYLCLHIYKTLMNTEVYIFTTVTSISRNMYFTRVVYNVINVDFIMIVLIV